MNINLTIGSDTLGDSNSSAENNRYINAVQRAIEEIYPDADVSVTLAEHGYIHVTDDETGDVAANCQETANIVWDSAKY